MSQMKKENSGKGNLFQVQLLLKKKNDYTVTHGIQILVRKTSLVDKKPRYAEC